MAYGLHLLYNDVLVEEVNLDFDTMRYIEEYTNDYGELVTVFTVYADMSSVLRFEARSHAWHAYVHADIDVYAVLRLEVTEEGPHEVLDASVHKVTFKYGYYDNVRPDDLENLIKYLNDSLGTNRLWIMSGKSVRVDVPLVLPKYRRMRSNAGVTIVFRVADDKPEVDSILDMYAFGDDIDWISVLMHTDFEKHVKEQARMLLLN